MRGKERRFEPSGARRPRDHRAGSGESRRDSGAFTHSVRRAIGGYKFHPPSRNDATVEFRRLLDVVEGLDFNSNTVASRLTNWRLALEQTYPNLLSAEDVQRRERILLKLLRLVPKEYQAGVRDGEIVVPLEYSHAKRFTIQSEQIVNELMPVWRNTKAEALERHGTRLFAALDGIETAIDRKLALGKVEDAVSETSAILQNEFGLSLKRAGMAADVVAETALEIQSLLGESLVAAQNGQWRKAEAARLDAYVSLIWKSRSALCRAIPRWPCGESGPFWMDSPASRE